MEEWLLVSFGFIALPLITAIVMVVWVRNSVKFSDLLSKLGIPSTRETHSNITKETATSRGSPGDEWRSSQSEPQHHSTLPQENRFDLPDEPIGNQVPSLIRNREIATDESLESQEATIFMERQSDQSRPAPSPQVIAEVEEILTTYMGSPESNLDEPKSDRLRALSRTSVNSVPASLLAQALSNHDPDRKRLILLQLLNQDDASSSSLESAGDIARQQVQDLALARELYAKAVDLDDQNVSAKAELLHMLASDPSERERWRGKKFFNLLVIIQITM